MFRSEANITTLEKNINPEHIKLAHLQRSRNTQNKNEAIKLLTAHYAKVKEMFKEFVEKPCGKNDDGGKEELVTRICKEFSIAHSLKGKYSTPLDDDLMNEAVVWVEE